jgi:tRNA dimethylallyltransferase
MVGSDHEAKRAILIAGPTASGKSRIALALAEKLGGVVINADALQVYADLSTLSARPSAADLNRAPHHLFGHVDAAEAYSVGQWLRELAPLLDHAWAQARVPVIVGGTGLYFKALTQGLSEMPAIPPSVRTRIRAEAEGVPADTLHARLAAIDPVMAARLRPTDPQRILRALEVLAATGRSLAFFQGARGSPLLPPEQAIAVVLSPDRVSLNAQIDSRFDAMVARGALDEVEALARRSLDPALPAMRALGVPPLLAFLKGDLSLADAITAGKTQTRQYAKRQLTFARHQLQTFAQLSPAEASSFLDRQTSRLV